MGQIGFGLVSRAQITDLYEQIHKIVTEITTIMGLTIEYRCYMSIIEYVSLILSAVYTK